MASPIGKQEFNSCLWEHRHENIWLKLTLDSVNKQDHADWLSESYEEKWCTDTHSQHKHSLLADCWHWNAINSNSLKWSELGCFNRILIRLTLFTFGSPEMSNKCHWLELQLSLMKAVDKTAPPCWRLITQVLIWWCVWSCAISKLYISDPILANKQRLRLKHELYMTVTAMLLHYL